MKKNWMAVTGGVVGVLVGMGFIMPAVAQLRELGNLPALSVGLLLLGIALTLGGLAAIFLGVRPARSRA